MSITRTNQFVTWPRPGVTTVTENSEPAESAGAGQSLVELAYTVTNTGTERARFLGLPNAGIGFPHVPGYGGAGRLRSSANVGSPGAAVAVRCAPHQKLVVVDDSRLRLLPEGVSLKDATLWHLAVIAMHGLAQAPGHSRGLTVVGAGVIGALARRIALARGLTACRVVAETTAKRWTTTAEDAVEFVTVDEFPFSESSRHGVVLDVTGTADGLRTAVSAVADEGRIVLLGSPRTVLGPVPIREIQHRGITIVGAHIDTLPDHSAAAGEDLDARHTAEFFELLQARRLILEDLLTEFRPEDAPYAYRRMTTDRSLVAIALNWQQPETTRPDPLPATTGQVVHIQARTVRFGVVGCGDIGAENARTLATVPAAQLIACFDTSSALAEGLASDLGVAACGSLEDLLRRQDIDAVVVATPHHTHEPVSLAVLAAGKHLLLEKPLAADISAARRICSAAEAARQVSSVLFPGRYEEGYLLARRALDQGLLGVPSGALSIYLVDKPPSYYLSGYSNRSVSSWRTSKQMSGGGVLIMNALHHVDALRSLLRLEATTVYAQTAFSANATEIEDLATMVVRFGGVLATFIAGGSVVGGAGEDLKVWGDVGQAEVLPTGGIHSLRAGADHQDPTGSIPDSRWSAIHRFCQAVQNGDQPDVTMADAFAAQLIVSAAYHSATVGEPVTVASFEQGIRV